MKEFFFDDDTFTDDLPRAEAIAEELGKLGVTWSCNAKANVPRKTLQGDARQRPAAAAGRLRIRQSADPAQHQEGHADRRRAPLHQGLPRARHHHPRHLHPRPSRRDQGNHRGNHPLRHRDQPAHHPGVAGGALSGNVAVSIRRCKTAGSTRPMPNSSTTTACRSRRCIIRTCRTPRFSIRSRTFYRRFYFRSGKIASIVGEMVRSPQMMMRRLREGVEFFHFLRERSAAH